jgi:hypothetical protein
MIVSYVCTHFLFLFYLSSNRVLTFFTPTLSYGGSVWGGCFVVRCEEGEYVPDIINDTLFAIKRRNEIFYVLSSPLFSSIVN